MALTKTLYKIFVKGFYKVHAGQLLFLFGTILTYLFYIQVLSDDHITTQETILYNLSFVLTIISSPILGVLMMFVFLIFSLKSYNYISAQIYQPTNFFLFYSANSLSKSQQIKSWLICQLLISFPIIIYVLFSIIVGWVYGFYLLPLLFLGLVLGVSLLCSFFYTNLVNHPIKTYKSSIVVKLTRKWKKNLVIIPLLSLFETQLITLSITKLIVIVLPIGLVKILSDMNEVALSAFVAVIMAVSNTVLIFEIYRFERKYLCFALNFPTKLSFTFLQWILTISVLLLPESLTLKYIFHWESFGYALLILISLSLFLKSILLVVAANMKSFLYSIFMLLFLSVLFIQFGASQFLGVAYSLIAYLVFYRKYYQQP